MGGHDFLGDWSYEKLPFLLGRFGTMSPNKRHFEKRGSRHVVANLITLIIVTLVPAASNWLPALFMEYQ
jgi:hypothetical protein